MRKIALVKNVKTVKKLSLSDLYKFKGRVH